MIRVTYSAMHIISLSPHLHTPFPPFSPSLISLTVSVDVKHHAYLKEKSTTAKEHCDLSVFLFMLAICYDNNK